MSSAGGTSGGRGTTGVPVSGAAAAESSKHETAEREARFSRLGCSGVALIAVGAIALILQLPFHGLSPFSSTVEDYSSLLKHRHFDVVRSFNSSTSGLKDPEPASKKVEETSERLQVETDPKLQHATKDETPKTLEESEAAISSGTKTAEEKVEEVKVEEVKVEEVKVDEAKEEEEAQEDEARKEEAKASPAGEGEEKKHKPLNVIVLYPDDMRHDSLSCAGTQKHVLTPVLDQIAREGIRFTHNCVTTSICWISRATLFSGQYVSRHQAAFLFRPINPENWTKSYPAILRQNGYYLGHIGKWQYHNTGFTRQAFDFVRCYEGKHIFGDQHVTVKNRDDTIAFLRQRPKDKNFALQVAFYAPKAVGEGYMQWTPQNHSMHKLYQNVTMTYPEGMNESFHRLPHFFHQDRGTEGRRRFKNRFATPEQFDASMKNYYRMIHEIDEAIKVIYDELKEQGILEETMIIFTTDNGFFTGEHGLSGKWFPYHESIRVPLIIRDPRIPEEKRGQTNGEFTLNIDLASTILGAAGLPPHPEMQGRDMADLYLRETNPPWRQEFYYEFPSKGRKIIPESNAVVRHDFKYFVYPEWKVEQLFNLNEDPHEEHDVINDPKYADVLADMRKRYKEMQQEVK